MGKCKECEGPITWKQIDGKWFCFDQGTSTDHWDNCSKNKMAQIKATGQYFEKGKTKGYWTDLKPSGVQYVQTSGKTRGKNSKRSGACLNCCPPWEICKVCPDSLVAV